jgi:hypothetical protein
MRKIHGFLRLSSAKTENRLPHFPAFLLETTGNAVAVSTLERSSNGYFRSPRLGDAYRTGAKSGLRDERTNRSFEGEAVESALVALALLVALQIIDRLTRQ